MGCRIDAYECYKNSSFESGAKRRFQLIAIRGRVDAYDNLNMLLMMFIEDRNYYNKF